MGAIDVGGRTFSWRTVGQGPPLLLVNGYAATAADWDPRFLDALGGQFEVICPDHAGMGESDPGDSTIDSMAVDLERLLDARGIARAPVVGWSMGGFVAQRLATRSPGRVKALVLLSTDPGGPDAVRCDPTVWRRLTDDSGTPREQASRLIALLFPAPVAAVIDRDFGELVAQARASLSPAALRAQEAAIDDWHRHAQPSPDGAAPRVLAAAGSEDAVIPPANLDALAVHWPDSRIERFAGCGHAFMAQEPERVASLIAQFVEG